MKAFSYTILFCATSLLLLSINVDVSAAIFTSGSKISKTEKAGLRQQEMLDMGLPLTQTTWPGAHNAYAAYKGWGYAIPNQAYKIEKLLGWGLRLFELDTHPTLQGSKYVAKMCHNSLKEDAVCAIGNKTFSQGLSQFSEFLDKNPNSVVIIKIEAFDVKHKAYNYDHLKEVQRNIKRHSIYKHTFLPSDVPRAKVKWDDSSCPSLPVQTLSKQDILNAGKQVVFLINLDPPGKKNRCDYYKALHDIVFIGVDVQDSNGNIKTNQTMLKKTDDADYPADVNFIHIQDDAHYASADISFDSKLKPQVKTKKAKYYGSKIREKFREGVNLCEAALVEWDSLSGAIAVKKSPQIKDFSWSWHHSQPNNGTKANCAALRSEDERISDEKCKDAYQYACRNDDSGKWAIANPAGDWNKGLAVCKKLSGHYRFAVPRNAVEMMALDAQRDKVAAKKKIWLNYSDAVEEGSWIPDAAR